MHIRELAACAAVWLCSSCVLASPQTVASPDGRIGVSVRLTPQHVPVYAVTRDGKEVLRDSSLGLQVEGADLARSLTGPSASKMQRVTDHYEMAVGKRHSIDYVANERRFSFRDRQHHTLDVIFRVSNDGVAFRYVVADRGLKHKKFVAETTSFAFVPGTRAWMQPIAVAQTGWKNTNPSYEEHYQMDVPVGTASPSPAGWVFPALFRSGDTWVALTEAGIDGNFHASRLQPASPDGEYRIGTPMAAEVFTGGGLLAETDGDLVSPWRIIALGSLATVTESTLGTDLAAPARPFDKSLVQPGHASWSWALLKDDFTVYDVQKRFIDYAADMHWDYTLIDADWDRKIGYEKVKELADYAATKHVGLLLWYNSSGAWNQTEYSPKSKLLTHEQRVAEFARLRAMGIKGVKIDFFGGDGRSMIAYYTGILEDAAANGLLVNFHGATLPRGWERTWPNLMTMEAVRGLEFTTFGQEDQDAVARHAAMLPFTRNLFDPMDFTPMVFGDIPNIHRATKNGFELAESVLFLSGIQHFAETPDGMATVPDYVKNFLRELPRSWDDVRFIDGIPGRYVVIARRAGNAWYVAGINADGENRTVTLDLPFVEGRRGMLITDGADDIKDRSFNRREIGSKASVIMTSHGGFVAVFQ
jgi:alpha-glucosidase